MAGTSSGESPGSERVLRSFVTNGLVCVRAPSELADQALVPVEDVQSTLRGLRDRNLVREIADDRYAITEKGLERLAGRDGSPAV